MLHKTISFCFLEKLKTKKWYSLFERIFLSSAFVSFFIGACNFFSLQGYFVALGSLFSVACVVLRNQFRIDLYFILSIAFASFYFLSDLINRNLSSSTVFYSLLIIVLQQFCFSYRNSKKIIFSLFGSFTIGLFASSVFVIVATIWRQGFMFDEGYLSSFWSSGNRGYVSRTGLSLYVIGMSSVSFGLLIFKNPYRTKITIPLYIFVILFSFITGFIAGNRSMIVTFLIVAVILFGLKTYKSKKTIVFVIYVSTLFTIFLFGFLVLSGIIPLPKSIENIPIIKRFLYSNYNSNEEREKIYVIFFSNFYKYPLGGMYRINGLTYVHNLLLDFYVYGGAVPFLIAAFFFGWYFLKIIQLLAKSFSTILIICFSAVVGVFTLGMFEPIYQANQNCIMPIVISFFFIVCTDIFKINERTTFCEMSL